MIVFCFFLPLRWRGRMKRVRAEQAGGTLRGRAEDVG